MKIPIRVLTKWVVHGIINVSKQKQTGMFGGSGSESQKEGADMLALGHQHSWTTDMMMCSCGIMCGMHMVDDTVIFDAQ